MDDLPDMHTPQEALLRYEFSLCIDVSGSVSVCSPFSCLLLLIRTLYIIDLIRIFQTSSRTTDGGTMVPPIELRRYVALSPLLTTQSGLVGQCGSG